MEALKALLESDAISEAMKTELEEAWNSKVQENKLAVTAELREEFAGKYEHDKSVMVEAIDTLVSEKLAEEMAELHEDRKQLAEAKAFAAKAKQLAESTNREKTRLVESAKREKMMNELVGPLAKDQREIMTDLLESVQTDRLQTQFNKYLPAVIDGKGPAKQKAKLTEGKEITGNREQSQTNVSSKADDHNVLDIRRLAGLN